MMDTRIRYKTSGTVPKPKRELSKQKIKGTIKAAIPKRKAVTPVFMGFAPAIPAATKAAMHSGGVISAMTAK